MKQTIAESGVQIDNLLTMALQHRVRSRNRLQMTFLAILGAVSSISTFLTMFLPPCNIPVILLTATVLTLFFCWHAEHVESAHISMLFFMVGYAVLLIWKRVYANNGMLYLLNTIYQTIYRTDWIYFEADAAYPAETSVTFLLCMMIVPILWLLSYAVMRYQNFFLGLLVTFPFVEVGFFFGIVPQHLSAAGLLSFWCGLGASQLAGSGFFSQNSKAGFVRRHNTFFPVSGMRFLLTECTGIIVAVAVLILVLLCDNMLTAVQYERPEKVKQMRTDFQEYAASIDWNDLSTFIPPFMRSGSNSHTENTIYLGNIEQRQYEHVPVSKVLFSEPPQGHVYLKFSTYQEYKQNSWSKLPSESYDDPVFDLFEQMDMYPPEFLYYTALQFGGTSIDMTLVDANEMLAKCVPYGFCKNDAVDCIGDTIAQTKTQTYTIYGGMEYESMLLNSNFSTYTAANLMDFANVSHDAILHEMTAPEKEVFAAMELEQNAAEAAVASTGSYNDFVRAHYLNVPETAEMTAIQMQYADLFAAYDARSATPIETVLLLQRIRDRLCSQVSYSLSPGKTPQSSDFVSYFLLESKKGYCTHYATAAVLLTRMAGIPARYCEGYLVSNEQLSEITKDSKTVYSAEILDSNAHAWCEVYLEGIGWIPFEFTFSYFVKPVSAPTEPVTMTEPSETETTVPQTFPSTAASSDTVQTTTTKAAESPAPVPQQQGNPKLVLMILGALLIVLAVITGFVLARYMALRKRAKQMQDKANGADYTWHWLLTLLHACGADTNAHTAALLIETAHTACARYTIQPALLDAALQAGTRLRCSPHGLTPEEQKIIRKASVQLAGSMYKKANIFRKFWLKWVCHYL